MVLLSFSAVMVMAEERADDLIDVVKKDSNWYSASWIWVGGAALFLLVLIVILRISTRRVDV
jgi:hypothetical protein